MKKSRLAALLLPLFLLGKPLSAEEPEQKQSPIEITTNYEAESPREKSDYVKTILPPSAQGLEFHGKASLSYVPERAYGIFENNEIKGELDLNVSNKFSDLELIVGADISRYFLSSENLWEIYAKANYKDYSIYILGNLSGSNIHDFNNKLEIGLKINIGNNEKKEGLNSKAYLDISYVPSRVQFGTENKNEVKTEIGASVGYNFNSFFANMGGDFRSYNSYFKDFSFYPDITEYTINGEIGYKNFKIFGDHTCSHTISYYLKNGEWIGGQFFSLDTPLYLKENGIIYLINGGSETEIGAEIEW